MVDRLRLRRIRRGKGVIQGVSGKQHGSTRYEGFTVCCCGLALGQEQLNSGDFGPPRGLQEHRRGEHVGERWVRC